MTPSHGAAALSLKFSPPDEIRRHETCLANALVQLLRQHVLRALQIGICLRLGKEWTKEGEEAWCKEIRDFYTLSAFAPARCVLAALDYQHAALRHNGRALRDGKFNRGTA